MGKSCSLSVYNVLTSIMKNQRVNKWITTALQPDKTPSTKHAMPGTFLRYPGHLRLYFVTSSKMQRKDDLGWELVVLYCFTQATQEHVLLVWCNLLCNNISQ